MAEAVVSRACSILAAANFSRRRCEPACGDGLQSDAEFEETACSRGALWAGLGNCTYRAATVRERSLCRILQIPLQSAAGFSPMPLTFPANAHLHNYARASRY